MFTDLAEHLEELAGPSHWEVVSAFAFQRRRIENRQEADRMREVQRVKRGSWPIGLCICGKVFRRRKGAKFCSRPCTDKHCNRKPRVRTKPRAATTCARCGATIQQTGPGRPRRFCRGCT